MTDWLIPEDKKLAISVLHPLASDPALTAPAIWHWFEDIQGIRIDLDGRQIESEDQFRSAIGSIMRIGSPPEGGRQR